MKAIIIGVGITEEKEYFVCYLTIKGDIIWQSFDDFIDEITANKPHYYFVNVDSDIARYDFARRNRDDDINRGAFKKYIRNGENLNFWKVTNDNGVQIVKLISNKHLVCLKLGTDKYLTVNYNLGKCVINHETYLDWHETSNYYYDWGYIPSRGEIANAVKEIQLLLVKYKERAFALNMSDAEFYSYLKRQSKVMNTLDKLLMKYKWLFISFGESVFFRLQHNEIGKFYSGAYTTGTFDIAILIGLNSNDLKITVNMCACYSLYPTFTGYVRISVTDLFVCACEYITYNEVCNDAKNIYLCRNTRGIVDFHAFANVQEIDMRGNQIDFIEERAFSHCFDLKSVYLPKTITKLKEETFYLCFGLQEVVIPDSVTEIEDSVFHSCGNLVKIVLPSNLRTIGKFAFCSCLNLEEINLPKNLIKIEECAFDSCEGLKYAYIYADANKVDVAHNAFFNCDVETLPKNLLSWLDATGYKF